MKVLVEEPISVARVRAWGLVSVKFEDLKPSVRLSDLLRLVPIMHFRSFLEGAALSRL